MATLQKLLRNASIQQGLLLVAGTTFAFALDYLFNLASGRLLEPTELGILTALAGAGQVLVVASRVIQTVVTRYVSGFQAQADAQARTASFFRRVFRSALLWGSAGTLLLLALSFPFATFLNIDNPLPVLALAITTILMTTRPVVGGVMQGIQQFGALGAVQVIQALLRLLLGILLMWLGLGAFGAMSALPLASLVALCFGLWVLGRGIWQKQGTAHHNVSLPILLKYSTYTAAGLIGYAILANLDAILAKRFFTDINAGNYGAAVILGKVIQFFPLAIVMILFPKAAQRRAEKRDPASILLPAMLLVGLLCGGVALGYFFFADLLIGFTFGDDYNVSGLLLGLIGVAMAFLSLANVWLNYFLSLEDTRFVYFIWVAIGLQVILMSLFHEELWHLPAIAAFNGLWLTIAGTIHFWRTRSQFHHAS